MKTKALYAGSFDPLTLGHLDIIERAAHLFDEVVIGVVVNLEKKTMFSFDERMEMIKEATCSIDNVKVDMCDGLLADFVNNNNFNVVVRGLRGMSDFDSEQQMAQLHRGCICPPHMPCVCGRKPVIGKPGKLDPGRDEVERNPRARSARLRFAEKLGK